MDESAHTHRKNAMDTPARLGLFPHGSCATSVGYWQERLGITNQPWRSRQLLLRKLEIPTHTNIDNLSLLPARPLPQLATANDDACWISSEPEVITNPRVVSGCSGASGDSSGGSLVESMDGLRLARFAKTHFPIRDALIKPVAVNLGNLAIYGLDIASFP